jgi:hypothetical protein
MTVTRRLAAILAADCDEISETGLLVAHSGLNDFASGLPLIGVKRTRRRYVSLAAFDPMQPFVDGGLARSSRL